MTPIAITLILLSALLHAGWNLLGKRVQVSEVSFLIASVAGGLCLLPFTIGMGLPFGRFPPVVWELLALAGACETLYYCSLARAYRSGDISLVYPLARAIPVLLVPLLAWAIGQGASLHAGTLLGFVLIVLGCLLLPLRRIRAFHLSRYADLCGLMALLAGIGTAGYTVAGDRALAVLRALPGHPFTPLSASLAYLQINTLTNFAGLLLVVPLLRDRRSPPLTATVRPGMAAFMGVVIYLSYGLVLLAMAYVTNVAYVAAFRQVSIPIGALLGMMLLREPRYHPRIAGLALITGGLILTALGH
ncbi:MAG TPA: EamA family transporter [Chthonomonadaceae bacterium]|nr:EamA family transporter [Chthonomonadaceae bacterium]